jgi:hypothetical protein
MAGQLGMTWMEPTTEMMLLRASISSLAMIACRRSLKTRLIGRVFLF